MAANGRAGIDRIGDRDKSLEMALAQIERQFGKGSVMRLGDNARAPVEVIPTGSIALDVALGIGGLPRGRVVEIYGPEGSGKALALDTPIPAPEGWTTMGELSPGQEVFAGDGSPARVTFATPVMTGHECFRVRFSDDTEIIADADHQWETWPPDAREHRRGHRPVVPRIVTTAQIAATLRIPSGRFAHAVRLSEPLRWPAQPLPVEPYTLGIWLADGHPAGGIVAIADGEEEIADRIGAAYPVKRWREDRIEYGVAGLRADLRAAGVLGDKHVPPAYLQASVEQRLALLQGLMDADGYVTKRGHCSFTNANERIADGVCALVASLGGIARKRTTGSRPGSKQCYIVAVSGIASPFHLPRKAKRVANSTVRAPEYRLITDVTPVPSVPVRCIQVDHPSHTYLAGRECIPTHNTTVALHSVANVQKAGGIAAFIDAEHALDPEYAKRIGVDTDALLVSQPDTGEQALEIADMLVRSGALGIIVIDSVAALVPRAEIEGEMGDSHVGLQARLMSQALRKLTAALSQARTTAVFINQLREKVGVLFGSPETTTGGRALKFYSSVRLDVRRIETLKDGTDAVGNRIRVKVVKNKMSPPFRQAEVDLLFGQGISREGGLIDLGVEQGIVRKSGAWYTYEGDQLGQGKENARGFLRDNPDIAGEIERKIKEKLGVGVMPEGTASGAGDQGGAGDQAGAGNPAGPGGGTAAAGPSATGGPGSAAAGRGPGAARGAGSPRLASVGRPGGTE